MVGKADIKPLEWRREDRTGIYMNGYFDSIRNTDLVYLLLFLLFTQKYTPFFIASLGQVHGESQLNQRS